MSKVGTLCSYVVIGPNCHESKYIVKKIIKRHTEKLRERGIKLDVDIYFSKG